MQALGEGGGVLGEREGGPSELRGVLEEVFGRRGTGRGGGVEGVVLRGGDDAVEPGLAVGRARSGEGAAGEFFSVEAEVVFLRGVSSYGQGTLDGFRPVLPSAR